MLGIISMITFLFLFITQLMILIIIGANDKTDYEQKLEDEEQIKYLREYKNAKKYGGSYMEKELYTWEQVKAYSVIALHNLMISPNEINLKNIKMVIEPLKTIHKKDIVKKISRQLIDIENKA